MRFGSASATAPPYIPSKAGGDQPGDADKGGVKSAAAVADHGDQHAIGERLLARFREKARGDQLLDVRIATDLRLRQKGPEKAKGVVLAAVEDVVGRR